MKMNVRFKTIRMKDVLKMTGNTMVVDLSDENESDRSKNDLQSFERQL